MTKQEQERSRRRRARALAVSFSLKIHSDTWSYKEESFGSENKAKSSQTT